MFEDATFSEVLDDLASRFIINVPEEELQEIERICFQIEQAHWFYEDFIREKNKSLPSMTLKTFAGRMFKHCPLLSQWAHNSEAAYQNFLEYKFKVPVCGAIVLNPTLDKVLLVKGWSSRSSWGFPRGKINKDEPEWQCAQREVIEETGFDILPFLVEKQRIEITQSDQKVLLYIITGVPETTEFLPTVRKEISQIQWHNIADLPCGRTDRGRSGSIGGGGGATAGMTTTASCNSNNTMAAGAKSGSEKEHRYYLIKPFVKRIKAWVAKHPEKIGRLAVPVNKPGQPPSASKKSAAAAAANAPTVGGISDEGGSSPGTAMADPASLGALGTMSVQELFKTVSKTRSPINGESPLGQQGVVRQMSPAMSPSPAPMAAAMMMSTPENKTASLLQTLIGGGSNRASPVPAAPLFSNVNAGGSDNSRMAMLANLAHTNGIPSSSQLLPQFMPAYPAGSGSMPAASLNAMFGQQQHQYPPQSQPYAMGPPGVSPLNAFAFDAQSIMNAYANPGGS
ncbi:mRNA-decapping enzyme subunit 2 [Coemansia sp. RSA 1722]|nr:mRNA-decapping enzyme subunit 2 [Coemansia sp. RSA 486]KAJ2604354.1 mRNA-decapping enzyme subunit 2 [Coemansia sp. RSA 1722]